MNFDILIKQVEQTHDYLQKSAVAAVNINLTLRNWLIGLYIVEFEQKGSDRAAYGERLLEKMAERLKHIRGLSNRNLNYFRLFYLTYPHIARLFTDYEIIRERPLKIMIQGIFDFFNQNGQLLSYNQILQLPPAKSKSSENQILQMPSAKFQTDENQLIVPSEKLISSLSFSHLIEMIRLDDPLKRTFYEIEAIKGNWSVKQLQRQINTLLFERTGMSENKAGLINQANQSAETLSIENNIRNPYFFEFLGLNDREMVSESDLENALLNHLQEFILELGEGFCFEARQKRIIIGNKNYFVDLVFYHRILKCHILIDLKVDEADYSAITQLNTYVSWYRKNMMQKDDKPSIGILLCAGKDEAFIEYALAGLDEKIFVSQYLLYIPAKEKLEKFIRNEIVSLH